MPLFLASASSHQATGFGGRRAPAHSLSQQRCEKLGVEGGRSIPSPERDVQHRVGWLPCAKPTPDGADDERGGPAPGSRLWSARQAAKSSMSLR